MASDVVSDEESTGFENKSLKDFHVHADELTMSAVRNSDIGMRAPKPILFLILWYLFSGLTLFFNKYIVAIMKGSETLLSTPEIVFELSFVYFIIIGIYSSSRYTSSSTKHRSGYFAAKGLKRNLRFHVA